ncbi:MAG: hypothetical protein V9F01_07845 [Chitinophagaceae bacterium]
MRKGRWKEDIDIATAAITGSYTLEVYTSTDILLASKNFSVEEFVPDRIRVNVKLDKAFLRSGDLSRLNYQCDEFLWSAGCQP